MLVLFSRVGCDQTAKRIAEQTLSETPHSFFFDTLRLQLIKNSGAFLGFGSYFSEDIKFWLFLFIPTMFLAGASIFMLFSRKLELVSRSMIALVISGGLGNMIDRVLLSGHVTDLINVGIGPVRAGIFNVADFAIMLGASVLFIIELKKVARSSRYLTFLGK